MGLVFWLTFGLIGQGLSDLLSLGLGWLTGVCDAALTSYGINPVVHSLVIDGIFAGVGSVLSFLPIIVTLFFFLSILEDSGYMARVAFVMDKLLRKIGLSGRSFVPMLIGFGCSVPAIMATRTLQRAGPQNDHPFDPFHELLGKAAHLCHVHRRLFCPIPGAGHDRAVSVRHGGGGAVRAGAQGHGL